MRVQGLQGLSYEDDTKGGALATEMDAQVSLAGEVRASERSAASEDVALVRAVREVGRVREVRKA